MSDGLVLLAHLGSNTCSRAQFDQFVVAAALNSSLNDEATFWSSEG